MRRRRRSHGPTSSSPCELGRKFYDEIDPNPARFDYRLPASVPIPKFASTRGTLSCELRNQRDTSNSMIPVPLLNPKFAIGLPARLCELRVRGTRRSLSPCHLTWRGAPLIRDPGCFWYGTEPGSRVCSAPLPPALAALGRGPCCAAPGTRVTHTFRHRPPRYCRSETRLRPRPGTAPHWQRPAAPPGARAGPRR